MENWCDVSITALFETSLKTNNEIDAIAGLNWVRPDNTGIVIINAKDVIVTPAGGKRKSARKISADSSLQNIVVDIDDTRQQDALFLIADVFKVMLGQG